jgi:hypothetical protein
MGLNTVGLRRLSAVGATIASAPTAAAASAPTGESAAAPAAAARTLRASSHAPVDSERRTCLSVSAKLSRAPAVGQESTLEFTVGNNALGSLYQSSIDDGFVQ